MYQVETTRRSAPARALALAVGLAAIAAIVATSACDSGTGTAASTRVQVATASVIPARLSLPVGETQQMAAILGDPAGNILPNRAALPSLMTDSGDKPASVVGDAKGRTGRIVTWASSEPARVAVQANGLITALSVGEATITAMSEGRSGTADVVVIEPSNAPMTVTPARASLSAGQRLQLTANLRGEAANGLTAPVAWRSNQVSATVNEKGLVTATGSGPVTITATSGRHSASAELTIAAAIAIHGLDFPGNAGVNETMRFEFNSPPAAYPATYIWRAYPRQQQSYYTTFFWGNNGPFYSSNTYYGFHPYPDWKTDYQHFWEIASPPGGDILSSDHVVYDRWYTQVAVCRTEGEVTIHEFYWDWPDTTKVVRHTGSRVSDPPEPALVIGDAPWNPGSEVWDGVLRGFQFYDAALKPSEIARELATPGSVRTPWYLNLNPMPGDITDKSGNGNHPEWVRSERPSLWSGNMTNDATILTLVAPR